MTLLEGDWICLDVWGMEHVAGECAETRWDIHRTYGGTRVEDYGGARVS